MKIVIDGVTSSDNYIHDEIENVELISIKPILDKKDIYHTYLMGFIVKYKQGNEILEDECSSSTEFYFENDKLLIDFSDY